jgi:broad specificity phosphatase PhoE
MGHLVLVRHGQASFFGRSYDELSPLGREQAAALGEHWAKHGTAFDRVYVGPRRRHLQTYEGVANAYRARGLPFPEPTPLDALDEHHGITVIKHQLGRKDVDNDALHPGEIGDGEREHAVRQFFRAYLEVMREWARGTIVVPEVESWSEFRARTLRALDTLCGGEGVQSSVAFTSGGFVCSAAGWLLGLDEDRVIDLSVVCRNTSLTDVSFSGRRRSLVAFNALPHLADPRYATAV